MSNAAITELYRHHLWSNLRTIEACAALTGEQLDATMPGTYGSIRSTLLHMLRGEDGYVARMVNRPPAPRLEDAPFPGFPALRAAAERTGNELIEVAENLDAGTILRGTWEGEPYEHPIMLFIIQALDHGTEHRTHIGSLMGAQGIEPPENDGWAYDWYVLQGN
jgi:uncharacterized damage-inducible protein DinB